LKPKSNVRKDITGNRLPGFHWCQLSPPSDTCTKVDTTPGSASVAPWDNGWRDWQLTDCLHQLMRALKAFADLVRTTSLACVHEKMGRIFRSQLQRSLTKFIFAGMERLPSAIYDIKWCSAITATALNSVRPVLNLSSATLAGCVLFSCCRSHEVLRRTRRWRRTPFTTAPPSTT